MTGRDRGGLIKNGAMLALSGYWLTTVAGLCG